MVYDKSILFPLLLDSIYEYEIKPMWNGGFLKNFLLDYKTGLVSITPIQNLITIDMNMDNIMEK